jgi:hypothetical protein
LEKIVGLLGSQIKPWLVYACKTYSLGRYLRDSAKALGYRVKRQVIDKLRHG